MFFFFFKQKTAYEMRISDWSSDVCSSDLPLNRDRIRVLNLRADGGWIDPASVAGKNGYSPSEPRWSLGASIEARQGLNALGASDDCGPGGESGRASWRERGCQYV